MYTWQENVFFISTSGASGVDLDNIGWCDFWVGVGHFALTSVRMRKRSYDPTLEPCIVYFPADYW